MSHALGKTVFKTRILPFNAAPQSARILGACLKTRPVRAPGLQSALITPKLCGPCVPTRRVAGVFKQAFSQCGGRRGRPRRFRPGASPVCPPARVLHTQTAGCGHPAYGSGVFEV